MSSLVMLVLLLLVLVSAMVISALAYLVHRQPAPRLWPPWPVPPSSRPASSPSLSGETEVRVCRLSDPPKLQPLASSEEERGILLVRTITGHERTTQTPWAQPSPPDAGPSIGTDATLRVRATDADSESAPLYRPGGLDSLQQLRDRGVLAPDTPFA